LVEGSREVLYAFDGEQVEPGENDERGDLIRLFVRCRESIQGKDLHSETFEEFARTHKDVVENWLDNYYFYPQLVDPEKSDFQAH
jgi:hypothetical protein